LDEAVKLAERVGAEKTYFTHMSHRIGLHSEVQKEVPENMFFSYDGLILNI
jgi:phosphoribosyl 1,2-cyclic phosphate phosphodiesterase